MRGSFARMREPGRQDHRRVHAHARDRAQQHLSIGSSGAEQVRDWARPLEPDGRWPEEATLDEAATNPAVVAARTSQPGSGSPQRSFGARGAAAAGHGRPPSEGRPPAVTVASIPSAHVYLAHLSAPDGSGPVWLPHPRPKGAPNRYGTRWPPVRLPFDWLRHARYDVLHVQFDFDVYTPAELREIAGIVNTRRIPLVFTVHDLRTTTREDGDEHEERLEVLIRCADALVTLTPGAVAEIRRRWGREALVVPHPHVVDFATMERSRRSRRQRSDGQWRLGLHLRWLRANMDGGVVPMLAETLRALPQAVLDVYIHRDVLEDPGGNRWLTSYLREAAAAGDLRLHPHEEMTDPELWDSLTELDATVLPYRFGTHSGWLEACRDLGTTVIAPSCGFYVEQGRTLAYRVDEGRFCAESLREAILTAYRERPHLGATVRERQAEREWITAAHEDLYRSLLGRGGSSIAELPAPALR